MSHTDMATISDLATSLQSEPVAGLYKRTYDSIIDRVELDGFFQESAHGNYTGMFPRTVGGLVSLFAETDEMDRARRVVDIVLRTTKANNMTRAPHVMLRPRASRPGEEPDYPIHSRFDQIDGNLHVLRSWATVALTSDVKDWEDETYPFVAYLMDVATDKTYLQPRVERIWPGLVHNLCLEHSREGRYWDCWDILTQSWACQGLREMVRVAERRGDKDHAESWRQAYMAIEEAVETMLSMEVDGKRVYAEMRLTNGGDGLLFDGLSWLNLAPVQVQWEGADPEILRNIVHAYREKCAIEWHGHRITSLQWGPDNELPGGVIGKVIGWDIAYALQQEDWGIIIEWLDFLAEANTDPLFGEHFSESDGKVVLGDPGNGEQCTWWLWGMAKARKAAGLSAASG